MNFVVCLKQPLVHLEPGQLRSRRRDCEETLPARQQGFGLLEREFAVEAFKRSTIRLVVARIAELEQRLDAAVDPASFGVDLGKVIDPVTPLARRFFVADRQRQQRFEFADAQVFPE